MLWTNTLWCELHAYCVNKQHMVQTNFSLVWSLKLWCDHTFVLKLGVIHTLWVWSHHLWVWAYHQYGVITTHVFPSTHVFPVMKTNVYFKWGLVIRTFDLMRFHDRKVFLRNKSIFAKTSPQWLGDTFALSSTWWPSYIFAVYAADLERLDMHHEGAGRVSSRVQRVISFFASQSLHNKKNFKKKIRRCKWRSKF